MSDGWRNYWEDFRVPGGNRTHDFRNAGWMQHRACVNEPAKLAVDFNSEHQVKVNPQRDPVFYIHIAFLVKFKTNVKSVEYQ